LVQLLARERLQEPLEAQKVRRAQQGLQELQELQGRRVLQALPPEAQEQGLPRVRALPQEQLRHCHRQCGRERLLPRRSRLRRRGFLR